MKRLILLFPLFVLLWSCSFNKTKHNSLAQILSIPDSHLDGNYFKNCFEIAEIIPIKTDDSFLISDIKKIIRYNDKIILFSKGTSHVFIIDAFTGNVEREIIMQGRGPGESRSILDIAFYAELEQIIIHNDFNKLLFFDLSGKFIFEEEVGEPYEGISIHAGELVMHNSLLGYSCFPYSFKIYNIKDRVWREVGGGDKVDFHIRSQGLNLVKSKKIWFTAPLDYRLFVLEDDEISSMFELDIPEYAINSDIAKLSISNPMSFFQKVLENNLIYSINSIRETSNFIVFKSNQPGIFIINKKNNTVYWDRSFSRQSLLSSVGYYPHEGDDNKVMFILSPHSYTQGTAPEVDAIIDSFDIKEDDNPILIFFREK